MDVKDLAGDYYITGYNQDGDKTAYKGILKITLDDHHRIIASWMIGDSQTQKGVGFYKDQVLVINFEYTGDSGATFKGTVFYKCLSKDVLEGYWSEEMGDPQFLGFEQALRQHTPIEFVN